MRRLWTFGAVLCFALHGAAEGQVRLPRGTMTLTRAEMSPERRDAVDAAVSLMEAAYPEALDWGSIEWVEYVTLDGDESQHSTVQRGNEIGFFLDDLEQYSCVDGCLVGLEIVLISEILHEITHASFL